MDMNFFYTINAQAAWNYEQSLLAQLQEQQQEQQHEQQHEQQELETKINDRRRELNLAVATGDFIKQNYAERDSLEFHKVMFRNEKSQETARTRLYLAQDRLDRFHAQQNKSPVRRRRSTSSKQHREASNYIDELFKTAQLNVAIGNVPNIKSRGRYSIPHTIRE